MATRISFLLIPLLVLAALGATMAPVQAAQPVHRVVFHVDENDPARMNLTLNNAANVDAYYKDKAEEVEIEIVAYGPGLHMLRADTSPVKDRVQSFSQNFSNISFMACGNTMKGMGKKEKMEIALLSPAKVVPAGVVHLMERQQEGWSYIRP